MIIGNKFFDTENHTYVMGILNVTPDSFYDGSKYTGIDAAVNRAITMLDEGAEIIDIGGESTRPGYTRISSQEEIERVVPAIEAVKRETGAIISLDTYKADVAEAGIAAGVDLINDIWGLKADPRMAEVIAKHDVACCLMHNRETMDYTNFIDDVATDLGECIMLATRAGIDDNKIMLDPGVGFAKDTAQNLEVIKYMDVFSELGYPLLLGVSRKSVVGNTLNIPKEERLIGTVALGIYGMLNSAAFLRVHDVKEHVQAVKMIEAVLKC